MRTYLIAAVLVGFVVGAVLGCASSKDVPAAVAEGVQGKYQVVTGMRDDGNTVFMRYDVNTGESWTWAPTVERNWGALAESE